MRIPKRLLAKREAVRDKRPRTVLDHILRYGQITTQELRDTYGYNHPPRAVRDVREHGIPIETFRVVGTDGRRIAAYRIDVKGDTSPRDKRGRAPLPKALKRELVRRDGEQCQVCRVRLDARYLQVDHRVPYDIAGDKPDPEARPQDFMLVCGPCNRAKSWSCEHCPNRLSGRKLSLCTSCYWARPEFYTHVATAPERRLTLVWHGREGAVAHDRLRRAARRRGTTVGAMVMALLEGADA